MFFHSLCSTIFPWSGRAARLACAALLLLLALHAESSASTLYHSGHGDLAAASTPAAYSGSDEDEDDTNCVPAGSVNKDSLTAKATFANSTSSHAGNTAAPAAEAAEAGVGEPPPFKSVVGDRTPDWSGIWRDTGLLFGSQVVAAGITLLAPESVSGWSREEKKNSLKKYGNNFVKPVIDNDKFYINYLLHPYWGASYYTRARERGLDKGSSFIYSTLISAMYEFGPECFYEKPSIQDLIVTPVLGSLLGAFIFEPWRESIKRKQELRWYDHAALIVTDPVGVLSLGFEKLFGLTPTVMVDYSVPQTQTSSAGSPLQSKSGRIGVVLQFPLN